MQACYPDEDPLSLAQGMTSSAVTALQQAGVQDVQQLQGKLRRDRGQCLAALRRALDQPSAEACLRVSICSFWVQQSIGKLSEISDQVLGCEDGGLSSALILQFMSDPPIHVC